MQRSFLLLALCLFCAVGCGPPVTIKSTDELLIFENAITFIKDFEVKGDRLVLQCDGATIETGKATKFDRRFHAKIGYGHITDEKGRAWVSHGLKGIALGTPDKKQVVDVKYHWIPGEPMKLRYNGYDFELNEKKE